MSAYHQGVLLAEAIDFLNVKRGAAYIDATAGGGGYTFEILTLGGKVLAIDRDEEAIEHINKKLKTGNLKLETRKNLILVQGNFANIGNIAKVNGFEKVDGIIFDLGVSSHQLDHAQRGFSFNKRGPLDMRMDKNISVTANDIINNFEKRRLNEIFEKFGQEKLSRPIADAIVSTRQVRKVSETEHLAQIISEVYGKYRIKSKIHPATRVFQALRIVVNSELLNLEESLPQTVNLLNPGGRLVIISFQSLEDAIVKRFFKENSKLKVLTKSPIGPGVGELLKNPRSRSAKLRAAEKSKI